MPQPSRITQPLFARARICREAARASSDKKIAKSIEQLAAECIRTTGDVGTESRVSNKIEQAPIIPTND